MGNLTATQVKSLSKPGRYSDGSGLFLSIKRGSKSWTLRATIGGKRREIGLGGYPILSLAQARKKATELRLAILNGENPLSEKKVETMPTFKELALETHRTLAPAWRNEKGKKVWLQRMEKHIFPAFGDTPINEISRADVINTLSPIWADMRETSRKLLQYLNAVFRLAMAKDLIENNPANTDGLRGALPRLPMNRTNLPAVGWREFPEVLHAVETSKASLASRLCFSWIAFTIVRGGEARGALWSEIDSQSRVWHIPGARMKSGKPHSVPLSAQAMRVLRDAEVLRDESGLLFPSYMTGRELSDAAMMNVMHKLGLKGRMSVHGVRACFRSWCYDNGKAREISEAVLAHSVGDLTERAYIRTSAIELRAAVLSEWGTFASGEKKQGKVVRLRA